MKMKSASLGLMAVMAAAPFAGGVAQASPVAPAAAPQAKISLPVVAKAQSLTQDEKAGLAGEGLLNINILNGSNLLNNLNILNIGSFNKWIKTVGGGGNCGCPS